MNDFHSGHQYHTTHSSEAFNYQDLLELIQQLKTILDYLSAHIEPDESSMVYVLCMLSDYSDFLLESGNLLIANDFRINSTK